jgi:hypothetical protein
MQGASNIPSEILNLLLPGCNDASTLLDLVEEPLDQVARTRYDKLAVNYRGHRVGDDALITPLTAVPPFGRLSARSSVSLPLFRRQQRPGPPRSTD